jgi:hypothetical protein
VQHWRLRSFLILIVLASCSGEQPHASSPTPTISPTRAAMTTSTTSAAACSAAQLHAEVHYQGGTGSLLGSLMLTNSTRNPCTFNSAPAVDLESGSKVAIASAVLIGTPSPDPMLLLQPGASVGSNFMWGNWCTPGTAATAPAPPDGILFVVHLPEGDLTVGDEHGAPITNAAPRCSVPEAPTGLGVTAFRYP